jgi:hypothetical protein
MRTRVAQPGRWPRRQQPPLRQGRRDLPRRHHNHARTPPAAHRRRRGPDRGHRVSRRRTGRSHRMRVVVQLVQQPDKRRPQPPRIGRPPTQPAPHRRGRPTQPGSDPPIPHPDTRASNADPTTSAASARRASIVNGSSTCVRPQERHRARRGTTSLPPRSEPSSSRTVRGRAHAHGANLPEQSGHPRSPLRNATSTRSPSAPTVSMVPPCTTRTALPMLRPKISGRAVAYLM